MKNAKEERTKRSRSELKKDKSDAIIDQTIWQKIDGNTFKRVAFVVYLQYLRTRASYRFACK